MSEEKVKTTRAERVRALYAKRAEHEREKAVKASERILDRMEMLAAEALAQGEAIAQALIAAGNVAALRYEPAAAAVAEVDADEQALADAENES